MELAARDWLSGNPLSQDRVTTGLRLWMWSRDNKLPDDFLHWPNDIVEEVMYLQSIAPQIEEEMAKRVDGR